MAHTYLSLGSNLSDRLLYLRRAVQHLSSIPDSRLCGISPIYETEPVSPIAQGDFLNLAISFETGLAPEPLLRTLKDAERAAGRTASPRWGPREIDIDILFYDDLDVAFDGLVIPHPEMHLRRFVLAPLADIAPDLVHPRLGLTVRELLQVCPDAHRVQPFELVQGSV